MAASDQIDTQITPESLERNFILLKRILKQHGQSLDEVKDLLTDEQKERIAAMESAIQKVDAFVVQQINKLNTYVDELIADQQELAVGIDSAIRTDLDTAVNLLNEQKVSHVEFTDKVNELAQVDGENKSLIEQTAQDIQIIVGDLNRPANESPFTSIAQIKVQADGIHQTVAENKTDAEGKISQQATRIDQLPGQINLAVTQSPDDPSNGMPNLANLRLGIEGLTSTVSNQSGKISALDQKADSIQATVATKANAAALEITNESISSIITELNKAPGQSNYASITQLLNTIDLKVQSATTGENLVAQLNLSPEGIRLLGRLIRVTGDTIFEDDVTIEGNLIVTKSITNNQIGLGALNDNTVLVKGTIGNGGTIPLPDGFTHEQCVFGICPVFGLFTFAYVDQDTRYVRVGYDQYGENGAGSLNIKRKYGGTAYFWILGVR